MKELAVFKWYKNGCYIIVFVNITDLDINGESIKELIILENIIEIAVI